MQDDFGVKRYNITYFFRELNWKNVALIKSSIIFKNINPGLKTKTNLILIEEHVLSLEQKRQLAVFDIHRCWILNLSRNLKNAKVSENNIFRNLKLVADKEASQAKLSIVRYYLN